MLIHIVVRVWARDTSFSNRVLMHCIKNHISGNLNNFYWSTSIYEWFLEEFMAFEERNTYFEQFNIYRVAEDILSPETLVWSQILQRFISSFASKETGINQVGLTAVRYHWCCNKNTLCVDNPDNDIQTKTKSNYHATYQRVSFV